MFGIKHNVHLKMPKFFDITGPELTPEEKKELKRTAIIGGGLAAATAIVYLVGYNRGLRKATSGRSNVYVIKQ